MTTLDTHLDAGRGPDTADLAVVLRALAAAGEKLDLWPNDVVVPALDATGRACTLVSEEMEEIRHGRASTGHARILDLVPTSPHQRVPLVVGSAEDVRLVEEFFADRRP